MTTPTLVQALRNLAINDYHRESSIDRDVTEAMQIITAHTAKAVERAKIEARIDELDKALPSVMGYENITPAIAHNVSGRIADLAAQLEGEKG